MSEWRIDRASKASQPGAASFDRGRILTADAADQFSLSRSLFLPFPLSQITFRLPLLLLLLFGLTIEGVAVVGN